MTNSHKKGNHATLLKYTGSREILLHHKEKTEGKVTTADHEGRENSQLGAFIL